MSGVTQAPGSRKSPRLPELPHVFPVSEERRTQAWNNRRHVLEKARVRTGGACVQVRPNGTRLAAQDELWAFLCGLHIEGAVGDDLQGVGIQDEDRPARMGEGFIPWMGRVQLRRQGVAFQREPYRGLFRGVGMLQ